MAHHIHIFLYKSKHLNRKNKNNQGWAANLAISGFSAGQEARQKRKLQRPMPGLNPLKNKES
jgi:hypothetical protein